VCSVTDPKSPAEAKAPVMEALPMMMKSTQPAIEMTSWRAREVVAFITSACPTATALQPPTRHAPLSPIDHQWRMGKQWHSIQTCEAVEASESYRHQDIRLRTGLP
jgi:hypothetical protein